ncbi:MAG: T9SS type A sorting domain-containing protein, partial [Calditrichaeota bacterium]|nr:T9SS type A sorting domain-containing protein [Calditrichota bacterium]
TFGWGGSELWIVDVHDPERPVEINAFREGGYAQDIAIRNDYAYVGSNGDGMRIVDISDPGNPSQIALYDSGRNLKGITISDNYAYVVDGSLRIVDISDPEDPEEVGIYDSPGQAHMVAVDGDFAYIADGEESIRILDISDRRNPEEIGIFPAHDARCVVIEGDYGYIIDYCGLSIVDFSDHESPVEISFTDSPQPAIYLYIHDNYAFAGTYDRGLQIIDISDPYRPVERCLYYERGADGCGIGYLGGSLYAIGYYNGLSVIDLSDAENPEEVGFYSTPGSPFDLAVSDDGLIYLADGTNLGVYLFEFPDVVRGNNLTSPESFFLDSAFPNPFNSTTTICYGLPDPGNVSLHLYNPIGQQVRTLFSGSKQSGHHSVNLNAGDLQSGLYFLKLESGESMLTKKLILTR